MKTTWSIIKDLTGKNQPTPTKMEINSEAGTLTNNNDIAKAFNSYFINIIEELYNNSSDVEKALQLLKKSYPESTPVMKLIPVTNTEVKDIIKSPLTHIFNLSLRTGIFPDRFKHAVI